MPLDREARGYHQGVEEDLAPGGRYYYSLDGKKERPDPASRFQPLGVHGPSEISNPLFNWIDHGWSGPPLEEHILYEIHLGTFTPEGTFHAAARKLDELKSLGIPARRAHACGIVSGKWQLGV
ncbi:MAG: hypothetical protein HY508_07430 [Acidobacteria bacterium]|nr:hypothetical protein [Acidobacteriota bacterium]